MNEKTVKNRDMTSGPLLSRIVLFVLPLVATNLLQVLYNAADMVVVSLSTAPDAVGAIGTTGAFVNLVVNIFIGFSTGSNVVVARHLGARDEENAQKAVHTSILISLLFGIVGGGVGLLCARPRALPDGKRRGTAPAGAYLHPHLFCRRAVFVADQL